MNKTLYILITFIVLYLTWHFGRYYEHEQVKSLVVDNLGAEFIDKTLDTGEQVNCILDKNVDKLFSYARVDY